MGASVLSAPSLFSHLWNGNNNKTDLPSLNKVKVKWKKTVQAPCNRDASQEMTDVGDDAGKGNPGTLLLGMQAGAAPRKTAWSFLKSWK